MEERLRILEMVEAGRMSVDEAIKRLEALRSTDRNSVQDATERVGEEELAGEQLHGETATAPTAPKIVWRLVFGAGVVVLAAGSFLLARVYGDQSATGLGWGWVLFSLGVLVMGLGWWLRSAKWLTVRVREEGGRGFALALPLPLGLAIWILRAGRPFLPQLEGIDVEQAVLALRQGLNDGGAVVVDVDEGQDGDKVEIRMG